MKTHTHKQTAAAFIQLTQNIVVLRGKGLDVVKVLELTSTSLKGGLVSELRGKNTSTKVIVRARKKTGMTPNLADTPKQQCLINLSNDGGVHKHTKRDSLMLLISFKLIFDLKVPYHTYINLLETAQKSNVFTHFVDPEALRSSIPNTRLAIQTAAITITPVPTCNADILNVSPHATNEPAIMFNNERFLFLRKDLHLKQKGYTLLLATLAIYNDQRRKVNSIFLYCINIVI